MAGPRQGVPDVAQQRVDSHPMRGVATARAPPVTCGRCSQPAAATAWSLAQLVQQLPSRVPVPAQLPGQLQRGASVLGLEAEVEGQKPRGPGQLDGGAEGAGGERDLGLASGARVDLTGAQAGPTKPWGQRAGNSAAPHGAACRSAPGRRGGRGHAGTGQNCISKSIPLEINILRSLHNKTERTPLVHLLGAPSRLLNRDEACG